MVRRKDERKEKMMIDNKLLYFIVGFGWIHMGNSAIYSQEFSLKYQGKYQYFSYNGLDALILGIITCIIGIYLLTFYLKDNYEKIKKLYIKRDKTNFIYIIWIVWIFYPQIIEGFGLGGISFTICLILLVGSIFIFHSKLKQIT